MFHIGSMRLIPINQRWFTTILLTFIISLTTVAQVVSTFSATGNGAAQCPSNLFTMTANQPSAANITYAWTVTGPSSFNQPGSGKDVAFFLTTPGSYNVTLTVTNTSTSQTSTTTQNNFLTVHAAPTINYTVSPTTGCAPLTVTFTNNSPAGAGASYTLNTGDGVITQSSANFSKVYNNGGNYSPTISITNSNGCIANGSLSTINVTASPQLTSPTNPNAVCAGSLFTYTPTSTISPGTTFSWTRAAVAGNAASSGTGNISETLINNTGSNATATYVYSLTANGCTRQQNVTVTIRALPTVTISPSSLSLCSGQSATLSATPSVGGGTYAWSTGSNAQTITVSAAGTYTVTYSDGTCASAPASRVVGTATPPTITSITRTESSGTTNNDGIICAGASVTLTANPSTAGGTYAWSSGQTTQSIVVSPTATTTYTCTYTLACPSSPLSTTVTVNALPTPNYTALLTSACSPPANNTYTGVLPANNTIAWTFQGGNPASANTAGNASVNVSYSLAGTYSIGMIVTNPQGCVRNTNFPAAFVVANTTPPSGTISPTTPTTQCISGNSICFSFSGTGADTLMVNWGDGSLPVGRSKNQPFCYTYSTLGNFVVTVTPYTSVGGNLGCAGNQITANVTITGVLASFTPGVIDCDNQLSRCFSNTSTPTTPPPGTTMTWNFGDPASGSANTTNTTSPCHNFSAFSSNAYTVTLTLDNPSSGCPPSVATANIFAYPNNLATFRSYNNSSPTRVETTDVCLDGTLCLYNETPVPQLATVAAHTSWNINNTNPTFSTITAFRGSPRCYTFLEVGGDAASASGGISWTPGTYTVSMRNRRDNFTTQCFDTATRTNYIRVHGMTGTFTAADTVCANAAMTVTDNTQAPVTFVKVRTWNWGDNTPNTVVTTTTAGASALLTNRQSTHTYTSPGTYTITLTTEDDFGCLRTTTRTVVVRRPNASFTLNRNFICQGQNVTTTSTSTGDGTLSYAWSSTSGVIGAPNNAASVTISYATVGNKTVSMTVTDARGCQNTASLPVTVQNPVPSATATPSSAACFNPPTVVNFANTSTNNVDPNSAIWNFNTANINNGLGVNPTTSTSYNPTVTFDRPGIYTVQLTVSSLTGCSATSNVATVNIGGPSGNVNITSPVKEGCSCLPISMTVTTTNATEATILFGDGQFQNLVPNTTQNITHSYCNGGNTTINYVPSVFISNGSCNGFLPAGDTVKVAPVPTANISYPNATYCTSVSGNINVSITGIGSFGGGTYSAVPAGLSLNSSTGAITPSSSQQGNYTITYTVPATSICPTVSAQANLTINQTPTITNQSLTICTGESFSIAPSGAGVPAGTTYTWSAPSTTGTISGTSAQNTPVSLISQTLTNSSTVVRTATYTITATSNGCSSTFTAAVTVNPRPSVTNRTATTCSGVAFNIIPTGVPTGTTYTWTVNSVTGALTGATDQPVPQSSISQTIASTQLTNGTLVYDVIPSFEGCVGNAFTATVTVQPAPVIASPQTATTCSGTTFTISPSGVPGTTRYAWAAPTSSPSGAITDGSSQTNQTSVSQTLSNSTTVVATASYVVTATAGTCSTTFNAVVTVNPRPSVTNQTRSICSGGSFTIIPTGVPVGTTYTWATPSQTGVSGGTSGSAQTNINGTLTVPSVSAGTAIYTVTPSLGTCTGTTFSVSVTVNAVPSIANQTATTCSGSAFTISPSGVPTATTYTWTAPSIIPPSSLTGGSAQVTSQSNVSQVLTGEGTATYTITPNNLGCPGSTFTGTVTVNPSPVIPAQSATICGSTAFTISPTGVPTGTTYTWSAPTMTGVTGGSAQGLGSPSISQTLNGSGSAVYTVTPNFGFCTGSTFTATVSVSPIPTFSLAGLNPQSCGGTNGRITVSGLPANTAFQYEYIVNAPTVVGPLSTTTNSGGNFLINGLGAGNYSVTVINPTTNCRSVAQNVTLSNPNAPVINDIADQVLCGGSYTLPAITGSNLPGTESYYTGPGGTGTAMAPNTLISTNQTVYIYAANGTNCSAEQNFTVTINPVPSISSKTRTICSGATSTINFASPDAIPTGTTYAWAIPTYTGGANGGTAQTGQTNFSQTLSTGLTQGTATYTVTATAGTCSSTFTVGVTINPVANVTAQTAAICSGSTFTVSPSGVPAGTTYSWTTPTVSPTGTVTGHSSAGAGQANISQTLTHNPITRVDASTVSYTVTPRTGTCNGSSFNVLVTVNPVPSVSSTNQTICSGQAFSVTPTGVPTGTQYTWATPLVSPSGSTLGASAQPTAQSSISQTLTHASGITSFSDVTYTVTPATALCTGTTFNVGVRINPTAVVSNQVATICSGQTFSVTPTGTPVGTQYVWADPVSTPIGAVTGGVANATASNSISGSALTNTTTSVATLEYTVTPMVGDCPGVPFTLTVTVNPVPVVSNQSRTICSTQAFTTPISGVPSPTQYTWAMPVYSSPSVTGGSAQATPVNSIGQTLSSGTSVTPETATYTVTPTHNGCAGSSFQVVVNINPRPTVAPQSTTICSGETFIIAPTGVPSGTTYTWSTPTVSPTGSVTGGTSQGTASPNISQTLSASAAGQATYVVTPRAGTCNGTTFTAAVTVNPLPSFTSSGTNPTVCNGTDGSILLGGMVPNTAYTVTYIKDANPAVGPTSFTTTAGGQHTISGLGSGSYSITIARTSTSCVSNSQNVVLANPGSPSINPIANQVLCGTNYTLPAITGTNLPGNQRYYTQPNGQGTALNPGDLITSTQTVYIFATTAGGCTDERSFLVTIHPLPTVTAPAAICQNLTGQLTPNAGGTWTSLSANATVAPDGTITGISAGTATFRFTDAVTNCSSVTPTVQIIAAPQVNAGVDQTICSNNTALLSGTVSGGVTSTTWSGGAGTFSTGVNSLTPIYTPTPSEILTNFVVLTLTTTDATGVCPSVNDQVTITIDIAPGANAGLDQTVCSNNSVQLSGSYSGVANNATWNSPTNGAFTPSSSTLNATYTLTPQDIANGFVDIRLCTNDPIGPCTSICDTMRVTIRLAPTVNAGGDFVSCSGSFANLNAVIGGAATQATWSGGSGTFNPSANLAVTQYFPTPLEFADFVTLTVTTDALSPCLPATDDLTITFAQPALAFAGPDQAICSGETVTVSGNFGGTATSATWTVATGSLPAGTFSPPNALTTVYTPTAAQITAGFVDLVLVTNDPAGPCGSGTDTVRITINPTPVILDANSTFVCTGNQVVLNLQGNVAADYDWFALADNPNVLGETTTLTTSNAINDNLTLIGLSPQIVQYSVKPYVLATGCEGTTTIVNIEVRPRPTMQSVLDQTVCSNAQTTAVNFVSNLPSNTVFNWYYNSTGSVNIGYPINSSDTTGSGNIPSFTPIITYTPVTAVFTVTPVANSCPGNSQNFTINIKPIATVDPLPNIVVCAETLIPATVFGGNNPSATYTWTNSNTAIGLPASGTGNLVAFTPPNSNSIYTSTITVTPVLDGCNGIPQTFTVTVKPKPVVSPPLSQNVCRNNATQAVNITGVPVGTTYTWSGGNLAIGMPSTSGTNTIPSFTAINNTNPPVITTTTITVLGTLDGCTSDNVTFDYVVNPILTVNPIPDITVCGGETIQQICFTGNVPTAQYEWTMTNSSIGIPLNNPPFGGFGCIPTFVTTPSSSDEQARIIVMPTLPGCTGIADTFFINVKRVPNVVVNPASQSICALDFFQAVGFTGQVPNTTYDWIMNNASIWEQSHQPFGQGNIPVRQGKNVLTNSETAIFRVTPSFNGCTGQFVDFQMQVNPIPTVDSVGNQLLCHGEQTSVVNLTGNFGGITTYNWAFNNDIVTGTTPPSGQTQVIPSFTTENFFNTVQCANVTINPFYNGCAGLPRTFDICVGPSLSVFQVPNQQLCAGQTTTAVTFQGNVPGSDFLWTNDNNSIGPIGTSGTNSIPAFTPIGDPNSVTIANIDVVPRFILSASNPLKVCIGDTMSFIYSTVSPRPIVLPITNINVCDGDNIEQVVFTSPSGQSNTYVWRHDNANVIPLAAGVDHIGNIPAYVPNIASVGSLVNQVANVRVAPTFSGCTGDTAQFTVTVRPRPNVIITPNTGQTYCSNQVTQPLNFTSLYSNVDYSWSITNLSNISNPSPPLSSSGNGPLIASFSTLNTTQIIQTGEVFVTPTRFGCTGTPAQTFINVNPNSFVANIADTIDICEATPFGGIPLIGSHPQNTFDWCCSHPALLGLPSCGSGDLPAFTPNHPGPNPILVTFTVRPFVGACEGDLKYFRFLIKPKPNVFPVADLTFCAGDQASAINFAGDYVSYAGNTQFIWTNNEQLIGLGNGGTSNVINPWLIPETVGNITAQFTVTPELNGCIGDQINFNVNVRVKPRLNLDYDSLTVCHDQPIPANNATLSPSGATLTWSASTNLFQMFPLGPQTSNPIPDTVGINNAQFPLCGVITVRPLLNGCFGDTTLINICVKPKPNVFQLPNLTFCAGDSTTPINFGGNFASYGSQTIYNWSYLPPDIGLSYTGTGNISPFLIPEVPVQNITAPFRVIPELDGCFGDTMFFNINVRLKPQLALEYNNVTVCHNELIPSNTVTLNPQASNVVWSASPNLVGIYPLGNQFSNPIPAVTGTNNTADPICGTLTVRPENNGCFGDTSLVNVCIKPKPNVFQVTSQTICAGSTSTAVNFTGSFNGYNGNTLYTWSVTNTNLGIPITALPNLGEGNIPVFTAIGSTFTQSSTVAVVPKLDGCIGDTMFFNYTVHPDLTLGNQVSDITMCAGLCLDTIIFTHPNPDVTYAWLASNIAIADPSVPIASSGNDTIPGYCTFGGYNTTQINEYYVTPSVYGCTGITDTIRVTVNPTPRVNPTSDITLCDDATLNQIVFSSNWVVGTQYLWTNNNTAIGLPFNGIDSIESQTVNNPSSPPGGVCGPAGIALTSQVIVTPTYLNCIGTPDTFNITVNPRPIVVAANDTILCLAQTFVPTTICAQPGTVFSWNNGAVHNQTFVPFQDTTLTVTGIDANLCTNQDSLFVTYLNIPPPQVYGGLDDTLCFGECTTLTATVSPAESFLSWNNGVVQAQEFCPPTTNDYIVTAVSLNGCVERDTVTVIVNPLPIVTAHASDTSLCAGQPLVLWGQGAFTYEWDNNVVDSVSFTATDSLTYTVIGTDVNGCKDTTSITIDVNPIPVVLWTADMQNGGCLPFSPTFTNLSTPSNGTAVWNFGNGVTFVDSTQQGTVLNIYDNYGCYPVTLTVTSPEGCVNSLTQQDYVCVTQVVADFTPSAFELPIADANFCFTNSSINGATFQWNFGDGNGSDLVHPCNTYDDWGTYTVCLVAIAQDGCSDTACQTIRVRDQVLLYVPNTFTPEGNDMNEIFIPVLTSGFDRTGPYEFKIYNRWGHEIFNTNSYTEGWDGTYQGVKVQLGTYVWTLKFKDSQNNEIYEFNGHVNLIR